MPNVFVVGAGGYIGFGVAQYLRARGYHVYGLIRNATAAKKLSQHEITPVIGDSAKPETYETVLKNSQIVIEATGDGNAQQIVFDAVKKWPKKIYIFTSGILVHGHSDRLVTEDEVNPPGFLQARDKFEQQVVHSPEVYGIVIRPGFVYGYAGGNSGNHINAFFALNDNGGKIVIKGNKNRQHSWVHIYDLAHAYFLALEKYTIASGQIFDIASAAPTYEELYRKAAAVAGHPNAEVVESPFPAENPWGAVLNISVRNSYWKAQNLLGWTPNHPSILDDLEPLYESWKAHKV